MNYDISIIIVNYNGQKYLYELFVSLEKLNTNDFSYEIIFVDNASADNSLDYLKENYFHLNNLKIVKNKKNEGFANGNNIGVQNASGKYVVLLNNDTKVEPDWLSNLYECHLRNDAGITTSKLLFFNNFLKIEATTHDKFSISSTIIFEGEEIEVVPKFCKNLLHHGDYLVCFGHSIIYVPINTTKQFITLQFKAKELHNPETDKIIINGNHYNFQEINSEFICNIEIDMYNSNSVSLIQNAGSNINEHYDGYDIGFGEEDHGQYQKEEERNLACGAAMMIENDLFRTIGGFDKNFFAYYEDTDLSFRVRKRGKKIMYCPTATVRHIHTGTSKEWSPFFIYLVTRNKLWFLLKNISRKIFLKNLIILIAKIIKETVLLQMKPKHTIIMAKSIIVCIYRIPKYL